MNTETVTYKLYNMYPPTLRISCGYSENSIRWTLDNSSIYARYFENTNKWSVSGDISYQFNNGDNILYYPIMNTYMETPELLDWFQKHDPRELCSIDSYNPLMLKTAIHNYSTNVILDTFDTEPTYETEPLPQEFTNENQLQDMYEDWSIFNFGTVNVTRYNRIDKPYIISIAIFPTVAGVTIMNFYSKLYKFSTLGRSIYMVET